MMRDLDLDALRGLRRKHGAFYPKGSVIFKEGDPSTFFYVILQGSVRFVKERRGGQADPSGEPGVHLATLGPGHFFGEMATFTGRPRSATAICEADTSVLYFDQATALDLVTSSPRFALSLIRTLCDRLTYADDRLVLGDRGPRLGDALPESPLIETAAATERPPASGEPSRSPVRSTSLPFNRDLFIGQTVVCACCRAEFVSLDVRPELIRPTGRDTDLRPIFGGLNPLHYRAVVCPSCLYASNAPDFADLDEEQAEAVRAALAQAGETAGPQELNGPRNASIASRSLELSLISYQARGAGPEVLGDLHHQLAWMARERQDAGRERDELAAALTLYRQAIEEARSLPPQQTLLLTFLVGELSYRLGLYTDAVHWFAATSQHPHFRHQSELARLTHERWTQAREESKRPRPGTA
ncbi:MAG: DUF2225 domain-containing protein [Chloroflexi bacterium]|nr:DUF2225 domain-containing protein [Chloroflexota bacterium]